MSLRSVQFPISPPFGTTHLEHGRTWEYVEPGMWRSIGGSGDGGDSGAGAGMVISPTEPIEKVTGMQWLDSTTALVWIWDDDKWLEFPSSCPEVEIEWVDIKNKPQPIVNLSGENTTKQSLISGGSY